MTMSHRDSRRMTRPITVRLTPELAAEVERVRRDMVGRLRRPPEVVNGSPSLADGVRALMVAGIAARCRWIRVADRIRRRAQRAALEGLDVETAVLQELDRLIEGGPPP